MKTKSQMGKAAKNKGKVFERYVANELKARGYSAARGQQFKGSPDSPDVECQELPYHFECKAVESLNIHKAYDQAVEDAGEDQIPVVVFKKNNKQVKVCLTLDHWLDMVNRLYPNEKS